MYFSIVDTASKIKEEDVKGYLESLVQDLIVKETILWSIRFEKHSWPELPDIIYPFKGFDSIVGRVFPCMIREYKEEKPLINWEIYLGWAPNTYNSFCHLTNLSLPTCIEIRTLDILFYKRKNAIYALEYYWDMFEDYQREMNNGKLFSNRP